MEYYSRKENWVGRGKELGVGVEAITSLKNNAQTVWKLNQGRLEELKKIYEKKDTLGTPIEGAVTA